LGLPACPSGLKAGLFQGKFDLASLLSVLDRLHVGCRERGFDTERLQALDHLGADSTIDPHSAEVEGATSLRRLPHSISFNGEVQALSTPTICRPPDSHHHQLSASLGAHNCDAMRSNFDRIFSCEGGVYGMVSRRVPTLIKSMTLVVALLTLGATIPAPANNLHADGLSCCTEFARSEGQLVVLPQIPAFALRRPI
jgi:hypothetical protein